MLVTTSFDLNKAKISVVAIGIPLCTFRLVDLALIVPFFIRILDFYELLHYIEKI